jgi:ribosomal-protein-alanine N-acetyltransferase
MHQYLLHTPRLGLRRWQASDLEPFARMNQDEAVMRYFPKLLTPEESAAMVQRGTTFFNEHGYGRYAIDILSTGEFIGFVGFGPANFESSFTPCIEIGWRLKKEAWGCGYAPEAAKECLRRGFEEFGLERVVSFTAIPNVPSQRVMQKTGMTRTAEFDHPLIEEGNWLRRHVLYEITAGQ